MNNKNTIKELVQKMEAAGENPHFIIGWLMSMIDQCVTDETYSLQQSIDNGMKYFQDQAFLRARMEKIQKVANEAALEDLYA